MLLSEAETFEELAESLRADLSKDQSIDQSTLINYENLLWF